MQAERQEARLLQRKPSITMGALSAKQSRQMRSCF